MADCEESVWYPSQQRCGIWKHGKRREARRASRLGNDREARRRAEAEETRIAEGGQKRGNRRKPPSEEIDPNDGYIQGWKAPAAVNTRACAAA